MHHLFVSGLLAAAILAANAASTPTSSMCPSITRGYDYPGNDLDDVSVSGSDQAKADACCKACTNEISCAGWVINGNTCYLKNKLVGAKALSNALSGKYEAPTLTSGTCGNLVQDVDYSGNDIKDFDVTGSPQQVTNKCCDACSSTAKCVGFVTHSNHCWLKKAIGKASTRIGAIAGVYSGPLPTSAVCPSIQRGYDYPGNDLDDLSVSGSDQAKADACCKACTNEISCAGWVISGNTCYLKSKLVGAKALSNALSSKYEAPTLTSDTCGNLVQDVDYSGNDIKDFDVTGNPQQVTNKCCDACSKTDKCVGFVTHNGHWGDCRYVHGASADNGPRDATSNTDHCTAPTETDAPIVIETDAPLPIETDAPIVIKTDAPIVVETTAPIFIETDAPLPTETDAPIFLETDAALPTSDTCSSIVRGVDYPGNDLKILQVTGSDQVQTFACCDACANTPSCLGFVLVDSQCSLKWVLRGKTELHGALSGQYIVSTRGRPACLA
ncbi:hypothetical protein SPRG_02646 [Saprolegnia parasitica CBS 223.65]|uniref:Apple domain-containing protein n=1 Tax=Saprolegnia parasitica (strain CBS 223.65) TaxID=695850 RepID=A0A067CR05_SAPPC|nr:hypothetical protein SPRG_02646 [Saprolegnia parasitica CBS 223.65]KDO32953.1 hypothetical protein SPRG_02646 [Saprolegnia parasitica CBS 223.65]|eukprot:XP_012196600.1 hypothetical protein SPRG_02646 [Saprolegnia parasitica CBS 223.65]